MGAIKNKLYFPILFLVSLFILSIPVSAQNLITNGDFQAGDTEWTKETGWSIIDLGGSNWVAHCDGTQSGITNIYQSTGFSFNHNVILKVQFTISNYSAGTIMATPGGTKSGTIRSADGTYTEIIRVPTGNDVFYFRTDEFFVGDIDNVSVVHAIITVTSPDSGNNWDKGSIFPIKWNDNFPENVKIDLINTGGLVANLTTSTPSNGSFPWMPSINIPDGNDFKIVITNILTPTLADTSNDDFSLYTPVITVTSPNGGENWQAGSTHEITWTDDYTSNVRIQLYKGVSFYSAIVNSTPSNGSYMWNIPNTIAAGSDYILKITSVETSEIGDFSDANFSTFAPGELLLISPNGGENWPAGSTQEITWTGSITGNVKIELYDNGDFDSEITASTSNSGSYSWNIPIDQSPGTDYKVKITSLDDSNILDKSDDDFKITAPKITVTSPNGGEHWQAGTTHDITWSGFLTGNVKIELYDDGDFDSEITASTPNSGSYSWNIPVDQSPGSDYKVKITSLDDSNIDGKSDDDFKITAPKITVTSPNGGEEWQAGTTHDITWTGAISGNVKIKLYDDGDFDSEITASTPNNGLYSWNIPINQSPGTEYKVKITKVDDDDITDKSDDDFTITGPPLDFKVDFLVSDNCSHLQNLIFGTAPDATDCFDLGYDRYAAPAPPLGIFDAVFTSCNDRFLKDIRETNLNDVTIWDVIYQRKSGCSSINFNWDPGQLPSGGNFHLIDFQTGGSLVNIDMRTTDNYTDIIDLNHLQIIFNYSTTFSTEIDEGFNMISLPLEVVSNFYLDLFPNAIPNTLFGFDEVYILTENIIPGEGYWLRFDSPETVTIEGTEIQMLELNLKLGWNMIGGPACNLPLSSIIDGAGIIIPNTLMGFNGVYYLADTILPGDGYWIRTNDSGTIILVCSTLVPPLANLPKAGESKSIFADLTGFITIDLEDSKGNSQRLFFSGNLKEGTSIENYSLPPLPPSGLFDARISGGYRLSESDEIEINLQSNNYPVKVKMTGSNDKSIDGYLVKEYVGSIETGKREISDGMELLITNQNVDLLKIQLNSIIPTGVVLGQNYPNPFNPGTIIKYQLPFKANVKLQIINSLGQEIRILVNEEKAAGSHEVEFDGSKLASGIYFYRIQAVDLSSSSGQVFDETKKMILMK